MSHSETGPDTLARLRESASRGLIAFLFANVGLVVAIAVLRGLPLLLRTHPVSAVGTLSGF